MERDGWGATALSVCCSAGSTSIVKALLKAQADVNTVDEALNTPLIIAAARHHLEIIRILVRVPGVNLEAMTGKNHTALMTASEEGHIPVVRELLRHGCDVSAGGYAAVTLTSDPKVMRILRQAKDKHVKETEWSKRIYRAAVADNIDEVTRLLEDDTAEVDRFRDDETNGRTSLMAVAERGNIDMIKLLLKAGASPLIVDQVRVLKL